MQGTSLPTKVLKSQGLPKGCSRKQNLCPGGLLVSLCGDLALLPRRWTVCVSWSLALEIAPASCPGGLPQEE